MIIQPKAANIIMSKYIPKIGENLPEKTALNNFEILDRKVNLLLDFGRSRVQLGG